jgi:hypothetical protein
MLRKKSISSISCEWLLMELNLINFKGLVPSWSTNNSFNHIFLNELKSIQIDLGWDLPHKKFGYFLNDLCHQMYTFQISF